MGKLNPKQVENLTEPGTHEDGNGFPAALLRWKFVPYQGIGRVT
jgi:hypothetical protein